MNNSNKNEEFKNLILEKAMDIIVIINQEGLIQYLSRKIPGLDKNDAKGKSIYEFTLPEYNDEIKDTIKDIFKSGSKKSVVTKGIAPLTWNEVFFSPIINNGEVSNIIMTIRDITSQKRAEENLQESEEKYRLLFDTTEHPLTIFDKDGYILMINRIGARNLGGAPRDFIGKSCYNFFPDTAEKYLDRIRKIIETGKTMNFEDKLDLPPGEMWFWSINQPVRNIKGEIYAVQTSSYNITERMLAEEALQESEEKFRTIADNSLLGIVILQDNFIIYANQKFSDISGYSLEEIDLWEAHEMYKLVHPEYKEFVIKQAKKKQSGQKDVENNYQFEGIKKDGSIVWLDLYSNTIFFSGRSADLVTIIDITDKIEAENRLKDSETKFRNIFEKSSNAIVLLDLTGKIIDCNSATVKIFGYSKEDLVGNNYLKLQIYPENMTYTIKKRFQSIMKGIDLPPQELEIKKKDGNIGIVLSNISYVSIGEQKFFQAIIQDITERKQADDKIRESEAKYKEAYNRAEFFKDLFAHDMNNILHAILTNSEFYAMTLADDENFVSIKELFYDIKNLVERGADLISNVQLLSEIEKYEVSLKEMDIFPILNEAIKDISEKNLKEINIQIRTSVNEFFIKANELLLEAFHNILVNAVRHNEYSLIDILINIVIEVIEGKNHVKIQFIDNGKGIDDERKGQIFSRGFKKDKNVRGMGIGLSLVKSIIESYDGKIWVEDKIKGDYSKGSKFILLLPEFC